MSPRGTIFFWKDGLPSQVQIAKGHGAELLGQILFGSDFAEDEIKKKLGLSLFSQVKQDWLLPQSIAGKQDSPKAEDKAESETE